MQITLNLDGAWPVLSCKAQGCWAPAEQDGNVAGWVSIGRCDIMSCALAPSLWGPPCLAAQMASAGTGAALHQLVFSWILNSLYGEERLLCFCFRTIGAA